MQIALVINGSKSPQLQALRDQVERLRRCGHEVQPFVTFEPGDARRMARDGASDGAELVLAAGGDGTVNEVANGLNDFLGGRADAFPRLGIIPVGTANDFANALGLPQEVGAAIDVAVGGVPRRLNVARVNDRCFLNVSTGGFGAQATKGAPAEGKRLLGTLAYALTGARELMAMEPCEGSFSTDDRVVYEGPFVLFAVGNTERTGGGNLLTPRADPADHLLDLCVVKEVSKMEFTGLLRALRSGQHLDDPAVVYVQAERFLVRSDADLDVNADGEPVEASRTFEYALAGYRLPVMVPAGTETGPPPVQ